VLHPEDQRELYQLARELHVGQGLQVTLLSMPANMARYQRESPTGGGGGVHLQGGLACFWL
jgi:hypothetical protein